MVDICAFYESMELLPKGIDTAKSAECPAVRCQNGKTYFYFGTTTTFISWHDRRHWVQTLKLVLLVAKAILIYPLFTKAFYLAVRKGYRAQGSLPVIHYVKSDLPWWKNIQHAIARDQYRKVDRHTNIHKMNVAYERSTKKLLSTHKDEMISNKFMGNNFRSGFLEWSLKMPAVALIATYLSEKHHLNGLYVCQTIEAFSEKLGELSKSQNNTRAALIVPVRGYDSDLPDQLPAAQHKMAILVEKKNGILKIAVPDYFWKPEKKPNIRWNNIQLSALELLQSNNRLGDLSIYEELLWNIVHSEVDKEKTELYLANTKRETSYGCETFSLRDGVSFLECPDFFDQIKTVKSNDMTQSLGMATSVMTASPPQFMKGTQSIKTIQNYLTENPDFAAQRFVRRHIEKPTTEWNLQECLAAHTVTEQNHYISWRSYKYHLIAEKALELMSDVELRQAISRTLISENEASLKEGESPRTIAQLCQLSAKRHSRVKKLAGLVFFKIARLRSMF